MRSLLYFLSLLLVGCTPTVLPDAGADSGGPPPPSPVDASAIDASAVDASAVVYGKLVEAGCMAAGDPTGPSSIAQSLAAGDFPWMPCLFDGGTVASCDVSCE